MSTKLITENSNFIEESTKLENKNVADAITLIREYYEKTESLREENKKLREEIEEINNLINNQKNNADLSNHIKLFQSNKELQEKFNSLLSQKQTIEQQLKEKTDEFKKSVQLVEDKENEIKDLEEINSNLKAEALKYQSALGAATSFQLSDDDKNNSVRLNEDIERLQDNLEDYVTNLRSKTKIHYKKLNKLFAQYHCKLEMKPRIKDPTLIKALLQRHVIEFIYNNTAEYFDVNNIDEPQSLESEITFKVNELISLTDKFAKTRFESSKVTSAVPIKIRQQIFSVLSNHGFSDIINDGQVKSEHKLISQIKKQLNQEINSYREITDNKKKKKCEELAVIIIREVIKLFFFRLKTQEPIAKWKWFNNNDKIDPNQMTGSWDDDDDLENATVEICIFPLIYKDPNSSSTELQIYTPAKVFIRDDNSSSSEEENGENGINEEKGKESKDSKNNKTNKTNKNSNSISKIFKSMIIKK
ncbi:hypothetical protein RclHR1_04200004 [Rhizophagus clarus]|uniref:Uncharacterized protein n=1 Tax=Rhizophagus clarus TaxID=94130 RepID=A0A2Z6RFM5_9GLOM|nr:hypothetical protein RclHR1_04200004 [Rhizophagus clarus]GES97346.1 hypothetical protein GLOIN_2v1678227 [Rhizophagus clarus]